MNKFDLKNHRNTLRVVFDGGSEFRLPDLSYDKFLNSELFVGGCSDVEYDNYLCENNMVELSSFSSECTNKITLIDEQPFRRRVLKFRLVYDSDKDPNFDENEYFGEI